MLKREYVRFARRWVPIALVLSFVAGGASYFITKKIDKPIYTATATLEAQLGLAGTNSSQDPYYDNLFAQNEAQVASQPRYIRIAIATVASSTPITGVEAKLIKDSEGCSASAITAVFTCSVQSHDPALAAAVANTWANHFVVSETTFAQSRYQPILIRLRAEELAAQKAGATTRYDALVQQEATVLVAQAQNTAEVRVITAASIPKSPTSPHPSLNAALAFFVALLLSLSFGLLMDSIDDSVRGEEDLAELTSLPILGTIPFSRAVKSAGSEIVLGEAGPDGVAAEAFRLLRTNIVFGDVDTPPRVILVTSAVAGDGKSFVASNLALAFAESGAEVILVDLDFHHPSIGGIFKVDGTGLTTAMIQNEPNMRTFTRPTNFSHLRILLSGPLPPVPNRLIGSQRMTALFDALRASADVVIVDSTPILGVSDALATARLCDAVLLVTRPETGKRRAIRRAVESLASIRANVAGLVVNAVNRAGDQYAYHYAYRYAAPNASADEDPAGSKEAG